jgi:tetratricopeptide (TPR) repeat protein
MCALVPVGANMRLKNGSTLAALFALALASSGAAHAQSQDSNFYYQRGLANVNGDQAQAFADFNEAIRLDPRNANAYVGRGSVRFDGGAMADYSEAIRLDPNNFEAYVRRAFVQQDDAAAIADYDQAIRIRPNDAEIWGQRAARHWNLGNREQAFRDADESIRLNPRDARAWFDRGLFHRRAGNTAQAEADFARALRLDPSLRHYYERMQ